MVNPNVNSFTIDQSCAICSNGFTTIVSNDDTTCSIPNCPAGQYMNLNGDAANNTCHNMSNSTCPIGQGFSSATATHRTYFKGSTENDGICTMCVPGQHKSTVSPSSCSVCLPGTYQNNSGSGSCIKCPKGTFLKGAGAAIDHDSLVDCEECDVFQFNPYEGHDEDCYMCLTAINTGSVQCDGCDPGTCLLLHVAEDEGVIVVVKVV